MSRTKPDEVTLQELQRAIEADSPARLEPWIERGVSVEQKIGESPRTTLLEFATESNAIEIVKFLIAAGAKLDKGLHKPLIQAVLLNRPEIARVLLEAGADPDITTSEPEDDPFGGATVMVDQTALMVAVERPELLPVVELLLEHTANPNLTNKLGLTALDYAVDAENVEAVRRLLGAGCKPVGPILHGPVFSGTKIGLELVRMLIAAGADLNAIGNRPVHLEGRTASEGAWEQLNERRKSIRMLERRPRQDWEEETLKREKFQASIYEEMLEELSRAKATSRDPSSRNS
jgi:ankyrin repeat protein